MMSYGVNALQDCEDHSLLLCSLLLGFGLNAFVCVGCKKGGVAHTWVMTVAPDGSVTFWESLTGERLLSQELGDNCVLYL